MPTSEKNLSRAEKKACEFLTRPLPGFAPGFYAGQAAADKKWATDLVIANAQSGDLVADEGIYLGHYKPKDRAGNSLGKVFNVFAAPQDLPGTMKYIDLVKLVSRLKDWHGFDGTNYENDREIYAALKDGSYKGGWIIPPRELLTGTEPDSETGDRKGRIIQPDNLFDHQNKGALKGAFKAAAPGSTGCPDWYWSSTEFRDVLTYMWVVSLPDGYSVLDHKRGVRHMACRPMRLVEASP